MKNKSLKWLIFAVLSARLVLAAFAQGIFSLLSQFTASPLSYLDAGKWWTFYGTLVDIGCLFLLLWITKKEGIKLNGLIGFSRVHIKKDLKLTLLLLMIALPLTMAWGTAMAKLFFGTVSAPIMAGPLPLWAALYSVILWPILWAIMEQTIYFGYSLKKLQQWLNSKNSSIAIVMFFWALQHIALPITLQPDFALYRFLTVLPLVVLPIFYLRTGRLVPLIALHILSNAFSAVSFYFLPSA